jgi:putative ABC transport system permease protein
VRFSDLLRSAFVEIRAHKVRSALTCVSLSIGVAAALYTLSQVASIQQRYEDARALSGPGRLEISGKSGTLSKGLSKGLTRADARALREEFPGLYMVSPISDMSFVPFADGAFGGKRVPVMGVTPDWRKRDWVYALRGRFFNSYDDEEASRVCVLMIPGGWIKRPFWAKDTYVPPFDEHLKKVDMLGKWISLGDRPYRVVGVLQAPPRDKDPRWFRRFQPDTVLVPLGTFQQNLRPRWQKVDDKVSSIAVDTGDERTASHYARLIHQVMLERHRGEKDFEVKDFREIMEGALKEIRSFIVSIGAIGIVAILAGGIGILNVTLATVFSRVREIGVRRALGATRRDIVAQFVVEALVLGAISGVAGSALGAAGVLWFSPSERMIDSFSSLYALVSTAIAVAVAFAFSVVPAWQASRLDPIESLRYE